MIIASNGALLTVSRGWQPNRYMNSLTLYNDRTYTYAEIYRRQPSVRTVVDFLSRNVAQLGLHTYQRVSDTDRVRLRPEDHPLAALLAKPNPWTTTYRLIENLMGDLGVYYNGYWAKFFSGDTNMLQRIPPEYVMVEGGLMPSKYVVSFGAHRLEFEPSDIVHFRGYNPLDPAQGISPLESLRQILAEDAAMVKYREGFWENAARMEGIIERPADSKRWSEEAFNRFMEHWRQLYSGDENSGGTAILEDGMTFKPVSFNAQESEYLSGRKLTREEVASVYHIPPPMVGILDHATFSNIKEQHKNLYQDTLGPWLTMIQQEIDMQILTDLPPTEGVYTEFNIDAKLAGSFEEQSDAIFKATGRPWMTPDEARAMRNLPSMGGTAAELGVPLNMTTDSMLEDQKPATEPESETEPETEPDTEDETEEPTEMDGKSRHPRTKADGIDPERPQLLARHQTRWIAMFRKTFRRQRDSVMAKIPKDPNVHSDINSLWDADRWNEELAEDYYGMNQVTAYEWADYMGEQLATDVDHGRMDDWLETRARVGAEEINNATRQQIADALTAEIAREAVAHVFDIALTSRSEQQGKNAARMASTFGSQEGAKAGGLRTKTWHVNSGNPRAAHAAMNGETVRIDQVFSNGMRWPHDAAGGPGNNSNCECTVSFGGR